MIKKNYTSHFTYGMCFWIIGVIQFLRSKLPGLQVYDSLKKEKRKMDKTFYHSKTKKKKLKCQLQMLPKFLEYSVKIFI